MNSSQATLPILSQSHWQQLEQIVEEFESAWENGLQPNLSAYLKLEEPVRRHLLIELVHADLEWRYRSGESIRVENYLKRFPEIESDRGAILALIKKEFDLRSRKDPEISRDEFQSRFSRYNLSSLFRGESDRDKQVEQIAPTIAGFEIIEELGRGGMGVVYQARQIELDRLVAVKMILAGAHAGNETMKRFRTEAMAVARLQHPNIVQIYEIGEQDGCPYFTMEYVNGGSLADRLQGIPQSPRYAAELILTLARAMHAAHQRDIVHRDLKPGNILMQTIDEEVLVDSSEAGDPFPSEVRIEPVEIPKITDFGLAKKLDREQDQTHTGAIIGTPSYMSPEQAEGEIHLVGPLSDVYSLGAILYELLTGRPPFRAATSLETVLQVKTEEPVPPSRLAKVPRDLETICLKCLRKEPHKRFADCEQLADELQRFLNNEPLLVARPVSLPERWWRWCKRNPFQSTTLMFAFLALVSVSVVSTIAALDQVEANRELRNEKQATALALEESRRNFKQFAQEYNSRRQFTRQLLILALDRAGDMARAGDPGQSLLWLGRILEKAALDAEDMESVVRANMQEWYRRVPPLRGRVETWRPAQRVAVDGAGRLAAWSYPHDPTNSELFFADAESGSHLGEAIKLLGGVRFLEFSADGRVLVCVADKLHVYRVGSHRLEEWWSEAIDAKAAALTPDGSALACAVAEEVRVWDLRSGKQRDLSLKHEAPILGLRYLADGRRLLTRGGKTIRLWDVTNNKSVHAWNHEDDVLAMDISSGEEFLATGCRDRRVLLWKLDGDRPVSERVHVGTVDQVALEEDAVIAHAGGRILIWRGTQSVPESIPSALPPLYSRAGSALLVVPNDNTIQVWRGHERLTALHHQGQISAQALSRDGRYFISAGMDRQVCVWDLAQPPSGNRSLACAAVPQCLAANPDGSFVVSAHEHAISITDRSLPDKPRTFRVHEAAVTGIAFFPDGTRFATSSLDGTARVWDTASGKVEHTFRHREKLIAVALDAAGKLLFAATHHQALVLDLDADNPKFETLCNCDQPVTAFAVHPDGTRFLIGDSSGQVRLHDRKHELWNMEHDGAILTVAFSNDGTQVLTFAADGIARVRDLVTGLSATPALQHRGTPLGAAFGQNSRTVITLGMDGRLCYWDIVTGKPIGPDQHDQGGIVCFARCGPSQILTAGRDRTIEIHRQPLPIEGSVNQLNLWSQVLTGLELERDGDVHGLGAQEWHKRRARLEAAGFVPGAD